MKPYIENNKRYRKRQEKISNLTALIDHNDISAKQHEPK